MLWSQIGLAADKIPAFPGAEGFGAYSLGGRGGKVMLVTTLADYIPRKEEPILGSFRAACEARGPRIVVFRVAGVIELKAGIVIRNPYLTIAGQSAPGGGVCLKNRAVFIKDTHDVVIRYLRVRPGDEAGVELDALSTATNSKNVILDHCSVSWANDEVLSVSGPGQDNITVQWCLIAESMNQSHHRKGAHGYGSLIRTDGNVTFHHNLYAHHSTRCPRPGTYGDRQSLLLDFRNNVIYNWVAPAGYSSRDPVRMNYIGNYLRPGPSTKQRKYGFKVGGEATKIFASGNVQEGTVCGPGQEWVVIGRARDVNKMAKPFDVASVQTHSAREAYRKVLANVGATLPVRDAVDVRIIGHVKRGKGGVINSQRDVGGWPRYGGTEPPADQDEDGMPTEWERKHGFDPGDPTDASKDGDGDGYTNVEEFLNGTEPRQ